MVPIKTVGFKRFRSSLGLEREEVPYFGSSPESENHWARGFPNQAKYSSSDPRPGFPQVHEKAMVTRLGKNTLNPVHSDAENDYRYWTIVYPGSETVEKRVRPTGLQRARTQGDNVCLECGRGPDDVSLSSERNLVEEGMKH